MTEVLTTHESQQDSQDSQDSQPQVLNIQWYYSPSTQIAGDFVSHFHTDEQLHTDSQNTGQSLLHIDGAPVHTDWAVTEQQGTVTPATGVELTVNSNHLC